MHIKLLMQNVEGNGHLGDGDIDRRILLVTSVVRIGSSDGLL
jgi:hypothetical protein